MSIILPIFLGAAYMGTIIIASFRPQTAAWNWLNLVIGGVALVLSIGLGGWIAAAIWAFNCLLAAWNLRMRLRELRTVARPSVWTEDRL